MEFIIKIIMKTKKYIVIYLIYVLFFSIVDFVVNLKLFRFVIIEIISYIDCISAGYVTCFATQPQLKYNGLCNKDS